MLVLSRKEREVLNIGNDIRVVVHKIGKSKVTIGVEAPAGVTVLRGELQRHTQSEKEGTHDGNET